jgi:putative ABC transport system permease protein
LLGTVSAHLASVNGVRMEDRRVNGRKRPFAGRRILTTAPSLPEGATMTQGQWWSGTPATPQVSISEGAARFFALKVGDDMEWNAFGRTIHTKVASIHRMDPHRLAARIDFVMSPGALEGLPTVYYGAVRIKPAALADLERNAYQKFPTVTIINMADMIERIQDVVSQIALVIRFISLFAILAGATILASSVAGTRFRRIREVVIFKTLGATRGRIARIFSAEFLILGTVAGFMGSLLATGFSMVIMKQVVKVDYRFDPIPNLAAVAITALIAATAGWLASWRILGQKPLEVLRGE